MRRLYAGIGSRDTPGAICELIESIAAALAGRGFLLRTGLSPGADQAFYRGARSRGGEIELYLPWPGFEAQARDAAERGVSELQRPSPGAYELAARSYRAWGGPQWGGLPAQEQARLARDAHQVLGAQLDSPADWILCWTEDARLDGSDPRSQGTGQALRIAAARAIPVLNLARPEHLRRARELAAHA